MELYTTNYRYYDQLVKNSIKSNSIWSLFVDKEDSVWMEYYNKGVALYDRFYDIFYDIESNNSLKSYSLIGITVLPLRWINKISTPSYILVFLLLSYFTWKSLSQKLEGKKLIKFEEAKEKRKTLLIVENNKGLRDYINREFECDYNVMIAENGKKGLKLANICIPDINMPEIDGYEFCTNIKNNIKTSNIPVIMLKAKVMIDDKVKGIATGADVYLTKPFEIKELHSYSRQLVNSLQVLLDKHLKATNYITLPENTTELDKSFITKVLNYIDKNIDDSDLNVEQLAKYMHLSRSQLYRKIKSSTGITVNELIRKIRLEKAKQLIENGDAYISQVGFKVGFSSPSYFTKCFKSHFGILPTELKN